MNFGTQELRNLIYQQLERGQVDVRMRGGRGKFAKDLAEMIYNFVEERTMFEMGQYARSKGASQDQVEAWHRVCKAFDRNLPMRPADWNVYLWIVEQDKTGKTIEKFARWARLPENLPFINQYFKDPQNIKTQWERAFVAKSETIVKNGDGSLYV